MECREIIRDPLLRRAFHAFWILNDKIYLHGGVSRYNSKELPFGDIIQIDPLSNSVRVLPCINAGPKRSHHKCVVIDGKWVCVIGGWDGKQRLTDVHALNMKTYEWMTLHESATSEKPAGLSSHTCTKIGSNKCIITGREGGVRMQRRYGSVYKLVIDVHGGMYNYKEMPLHILSRSGHSACMLEKESDVKSKMSLLILGGRDSDGGEIVGSWDRSQMKIPANTHELESKIESHMATSSGKNQTNTGYLFVETKPRYLRHHAVVPVGKFCLIHGGEVFGKARDTVSADIFFHNSTASRWWSLVFGKQPQCDETLLKRMGHSICYMNSCIYIISGIGSNGKDAEGSVLSLAL